MGQKAHPIGLRLGKSLLWNTEWFSKSQLISSKLVFQIYQLKTLLNGFLYKNKYFIHSVYLKFNKNSLFLNIFIIPFFTHWLILKKNKVNFLKNLKLVLYKLKKNKKIKNFLKKHKHYNKKCFLFLFKQFLKLDSFYKNKLEKDNTNFISFNNLKKISSSIQKYQNFPTVILKIQDLTKSIKMPYKKQLKKRELQDHEWFYLFILMQKFGSSSFLLGNFLKLVLENRRLKKQQRFLIDNLREFLLENMKLLTKIKGLKVQIKGRINGSDRSILYKTHFGCLPLQTFQQPIDYSFSTAYTSYGTFGIKTWIIPLNKNVSTKENKIQKIS